MTFLILKYGKRRAGQDERRNKSGPRYYTNNGGFFIKPYLTIEPSDKPQTKNITISNLEYPSIEVDPEVFKRNVWVLKIRSNEKRIGKYSISKTAYNCRIGLSIIRDNQSLFEELPLHYLPAKCNYTGPTKYVNGRRQQHAGALPNVYVARLLADTKDTVKVFPVGTENDALLLFTFEDCEHVYVITHRKDENGQHTNITQLDFNKDYLFHLRLYSDGFKELREKRFKFVAKSWDDVTFKEIK
jgi:hypothetical protein